MKIALKIVVICLIAMMLITALSSFLIARREIERAKEDQQEETSRVAELISESVDLAYQSEGQRGIIKAIKTQTVQSGQLRYRWVWFDVSVNDPNHPVAPVESLQKVLTGDMDSVVFSNNGRKDLHTYSLLDVNDENGKTRKGAIEVSGSLETAEQEAWQTIRTGLAAIGAMAVFCIGIVSWVGVRMIGSPLKKLVRQTQKIGDGDYESTEEIQTNDEFGQLSTALNAMAKKISGQQELLASEAAANLETLEQLRHADRLKTVGRLAAGIAHEIGTPLNVVSGRAGLIRSGKLSQQELEESADAIQFESNRIAGIVQQLMDFARHNPPKRTATDLRVVVERTIELLRTLASKNNHSIEFTSVGDPPFTAFIDESQIQQVLTNLIVNATQAMPDGGKVELQIANKNRDLDGVSVECVEVLIVDQGGGIEESMRDNIFEPFFTTKEIGQGTGLGLSIAHGIVEEHAGTIEFESQLGVGTTFRLLLPKTKPNQETK